MTQREFALKFKSYMGTKKTIGQAERDVRGFMETLKTIFKEGEENKVIFPGLGTFAVKIRKEKRTVHPRTKQPLIIPERKKVTFKCSSSLESLVNYKEIKIKETTDIENTEEKAE